MNKIFPSKAHSGLRLFDRTRDAAAILGDLAFENANALDADGAFPHEDILEMRRLGLLTAPLPRALGGAEPTGVELAQWLRRVGGGSLPLGRLYEGHVNAIGLILSYGNPSQAVLMAGDVGEGELFAVWNTDDAQGLRLVRDHVGFHLEGRKVLASGAGFTRRPLVTATDERGQRLMVTPRLGGREQADLSRWTAQGMRASATGSIDLSGVSIHSDDIVGEAGDYERQPLFSGGAWRFCAVQQGAMETLFGLLRQHLRSASRGGDPHQLARVGQAGIAVETALLWIERAATLFDDCGATVDADRVVAYVNLARLAVERAGLDLMELVHRSVGLRSFIRPDPIERISRDLATYLRQPAPDRALSSAASWILDSKEDIVDLWTGPHASV